MNLQDQKDNLPSYGVKKISKKAGLNFNKQNLIFEKRLFSINEDNDKDNQKSISIESQNEKSEYFDKNDEVSKSKNNKK